MPHALCTHWLCLSLSMYLHRSVCPRRRIWRRPRRRRWCSRCRRRRILRPWTTSGSASSKTVSRQPFVVTTVQDLPVHWLALPGDVDAVNTRWFGLLKDGVLCTAPCRETLQRWAACPLASASLHYSSFSVGQ